MKNSQADQIIAEWRQDIDKELPQGDQFIIAFKGWSGEIVSWLINTEGTNMLLARVKNDPVAKQSAQIFTREQAIDRIFDLRGHGWLTVAEVI